MTDEKKPPPKADEYSAFKSLLDKIAKVPKDEILEEQRRLDREPPLRKKSS